MAPCCRAQTAASAQRGSASLVPREAEGDPAAHAGQLKLLPGPALSRTDVTSERSSAPHWQGKKLDREPMGPRALPLGRCQEPLLAGSEDLFQGPPSESGRARNSPSATQTSQSLPVTTVQGRALATRTPCSGSSFVCSYQALTVC